MTKKFIDSENFRNEVNDLGWGDTCDCEYNDAWDDAMSAILEILDNQPAADVQEVVRCKNCKYAIETKAVFGIVDYECRRHGVSGFSADDFCSYGARMDGEEND